MESLAKIAQEADRSMIVSIARLKDRRLARIVKELNKISTPADKFNSSSVREELARQERLKGPETRRAELLATMQETREYLQQLEEQLSQIDHEYTSTDAKAVLLTNTNPALEEDASTVFGTDVGDHEYQSNHTNHELELAIETSETPSRKYGAKSTNPYAMMNTSELKLLFNQRKKTALGRKIGLVSGGLKKELIKSL